MKCKCNGKTIIHSRSVRILKDLSHGLPCDKEIPIAKIKCMECNHIYTHPELDRTPITEAFKRMIISRCLQDSYTSVAKYAGISDVSVRNIFIREVEEKHQMIYNMPVIINMNILKNIIIISSGIDQSFIDVTDNLDMWLQDKQCHQTKYILLSSIPKCMLSIFIKIINCLKKYFLQAEFIISEENLKFGYELLFRQHLKKMNIKSNSFMIDDFFNADDYWIDMWPDAVCDLYKQWNNLILGKSITNINIVIDSVYNQIAFSKEQKWMSKNLIFMQVQQKKMERIYPVSIMHIKYYLVNSYN